MAEEWLSLTEAANRVQGEYARAGRRISRKTVSRWATAGLVRAERRGARWFVQADSLREFVAEQLAGRARRPRLAPPRPRLASAPREETLDELCARIACQERRFLHELRAGID
jgi:hypothetical protein